MEGRKGRNEVYLDFLIKLQELVAEDESVFVHMDDVGRLLKIPPKVCQEIVDYLEDKRLVEYGLDRKIKLTHWGLLEAKRPR